MAHHRGTNGLAQSCGGRFSALHSRRAQRRTLGRSTFATPAIWTPAWCTLFPACSDFERCQAGVDRLIELLPSNARAIGSRVCARSASEVCLLLHGLEFARVRHGMAAALLRSRNEITFGAGANETPLTPENEPLCKELLGAPVRAAAIPTDRTRDALFRLQPERWLESRLRNNIDELLPSLRGDLFYSQVPALSSRRSRHARSAHARSRRPPGGDRVEGRRRFAPALAGARLLDARTGAESGPADRGRHCQSPCRPSSGRAILPEPRSQRGLPRMIAGCARAAHSSRQRAGSALSLALNRVGADRPGRTLAPRTKFVPQTHNSRKIRALGSGEECFPV